MLPLKRTSGFFLLCTLSYGVLMAPWPGVQDAYRAYFRAGGNLIFCTVGPAGSVTFEPIATAGTPQDTTLKFARRRPPHHKGSMTLRTNHVGYRPTAFIIALALATPIPWTRRWRSLVWSLVLVQGFVLLRVELIVLDTFGELAGYSFGPQTKTVLHAATSILFKAPGGIYIGPMFIWLAVTFRRGDMAEIFGVTDSRKSAKPRSRRSKHHS